MLEKTGFTKDDCCKVVKRFHILSFYIDRKGENIVSHINSTIAFMDRE